MTDAPARLRRLAILAFVGHYPAVRILGRRRLRPAWVKKNLAAIGATFLAMGIGGVVGAGSGEAGAAVLVAFLVGHFAWSAWLAWGIATARALLPEAASATATG